LLRHGPKAISTQFHPEFNADVMRAYVKRKHADMRREGRIRCAPSKRRRRHTGGSPAACGNSPTSMVG
jgi:hypothetical protein